jgi:hypothetical protein
MRRESVYNFSPKDKKILELRDKDGMTFSEISRKLGNISTSRAADRYKRLKILSAELEIIKKYRYMDPKLVDDSEFIHFAFANLSSLTFNALSRRRDGVLHSKEKFMNMTETDIIHTKYIGAGGLLEIQNLQNILRNASGNEK